MSVSRGRDEGAALLDARPLSGLAAGNVACYTCLWCRKYKPRDAFDCYPQGRVHDLCLDCEARQKMVEQRFKQKKDRSHITVTEKVCEECGETKSADLYWLDGKEPDGLKRKCARCMTIYHKNLKTTPERDRRRNKPAPNGPIMYDSFTPASALQPVLDQAIKERDEAVARLEELERRLKSDAHRPQSVTPDDIVRQLDVVVDEFRRLQARAAAEKQPPLDATRYLKQGWRRAALLIGPVAYSVFKWADATILEDDSQPKRK